MKYKSITIRIAIITTALFLLSACAGKTGVNEASGDKTPAETATPEPAPVETGQPSSAVEVIPLDKSAASPGKEPASPQAAGSVGTSVGSVQQTSVKNQTAPAPAADISSSFDISGVTQKMLNNEMTLWHSMDKTYRLYVGEQFAALYSPDDKTLTIKSDSPGSNLECKYAMDGKLDSQQSAQKKACEGMVKMLDNFVSSN